MSPDRSSNSGCLKLVVAVAFAFFFLRDKMRSSPGPARQAPSSAARPAPPPPAPKVPVGPMKFDWPRNAGAQDKVALAKDLTMRNFYIVLDGSGSMADRKCSGEASKLEVAKQALAEFAKTVPASAQLGLLAFDDKGMKERVPLGLGNRDRFEAEVRAVTANGGTPLRSAIELGLSKLEDAARRQLGYGEYNLVIVTDGEASPGEDPRAVVDAVLARSPVIIHTIGFCIGNNHSLNQPGRTVYMTADNPAELRSGLGSVLAEAASFDAAGFDAPKGGKPSH